MGTYTISGADRDDPWSDDGGRPFVGVTSRRLTVDNRPLDVVEHDYMEAIAVAGGLPCLLPVVGDNLSAAWLGQIDGLLLTGGGDIDPCRYGAAPSEQVGGVDVARDAFEEELTLAALDRGLPVLGICRGCQVINVATGGTLHQHLPDVTVEPHLVPEPRDRPAHEVAVEAHSQLAQVLGSERIRVNSIHHQSIDRCGGVLQAVAWAADGVIEGIESRHPPVLGVQWHPENLTTSSSQRALFSWLVQRAAEHSRMRDHDRVVRPLWQGAGHG